MGHPTPQLTTNVFAVSPATGRLEGPWPYGDRPGIFAGPARQGQQSAANLISGAPLQPARVISFNGLTNNQAVNTSGGPLASDAFWGSYANGFGCRGDTSLAYGANSSSLNMSIQQGSDGGLGGGTGPNGSFGFGFGFSGKTVSEGQTLWAGFRIFTPVGFNFTTNTGFLKFIRLEQSGSGGKIENFVAYDGAGAANGWNLGDENFTNGQEQTLKQTQGVMAPGVWTWAEIKVKASSTAAGAYRSLTIGNTLQFEIVDGVSTRWLQPNGTYATGILSTPEPTLVNSSSFFTDIMFCTYWNGNAPRTQALNLQVIAVYRSDHPPTAIDNLGNVIIGANTHQ